MVLAAHRDSCCFRMAVSLIGDCTRFDGDITRTADTVTAYLALRHPTVNNASSNKRLDSMHGKDFYACGLPNTHHQVPVWLGAQSFLIARKTLERQREQRSYVDFLKSVSLLCSVLGRSNFLRRQTTRW